MEFEMLNWSKLKEYYNSDDYLISIQDQMYKAQNMWLESELEKALRENATPPVTGEITAGKIKWRGIQRFVQGDNIWLEQRGVRISPLLSMRITHDYSDINLS